MTKIKVKAKDGLMFPFENSPRRMIEQTPVEVDSSTYYQRALTNGDLVQVEDTEKTPEQTEASEETKTPVTKPVQKKEQK